MSRLRDAALRTGGALLTAVGVVLLSVALTALVVLALGGKPGQALTAIYAGSLGSVDSVVETLLKATPLIFTGLAVAIAFRCGIWNIGAEGQLLVGMLGAAWTALAMPKAPPTVAVTASLLAGAAMGALWSALPAFLKLKRDVPEVISTIMLNFLAVYLLEYLVRGPMKDPTSVSDWSSAVPDAAHLPRLRAFIGAFPPAPPLLRLHVGVFLAVGVAGLLWLWMARTGLGFRIRAVGSNAVAARAAGIPVAQTVATSFLLSGALAGLGGAVEQLAMIARLHRYLPGDPGYGFSGIAVALLAQLHPGGVVASALFFGGLAAGCGQMQRTAGISFHVADVVQAAIVLLLIALPRKFARKRDSAE